LGWRRIVNAVADLHIPARFPIPNISTDGLTGALCLSGDAAPAPVGLKVGGPRPTAAHFRKVLTSGRKPLQSPAAASAYQYRRHHAVGGYDRTRPRKGRRRARNTTQRCCRGIAKCGSSKRPQGVRSAHSSWPCADRAGSRYRPSPAKCHLGSGWGDCTERAPHARKGGTPSFTQGDGQIHRHPLAALLVADWALSQLPRAAAG
jgi:hypothetical protein